MHVTHYRKISKTFNLSQDSPPTSQQVALLLLLWFAVLFAHFFWFTELGSDNVFNDSYGPGIVDAFWYARPLSSDLRVVAVCLASCHNCFFTCSVSYTVSCSHRSFDCSGIIRSFRKHNFCDCLPCPFCPCPGTALTSFACVSSGLITWQVFYRYSSNCGVWG